MSQVPGRMPSPPGHVVSQSSWGPGPGISYGMAATGLLLLLVALLLTCCWPGSCQPAARSKQPAAVSSSSQPAGQQASQPSCTQPASQSASHPKPPPHRELAGSMQRLGVWGSKHIFQIKIISNMMFHCLNPCFHSSNMNLHSSNQVFRILI